MSKGTPIWDPSPLHHNIGQRRVAAILLPKEEGESVQDQILVEHQWLGLKHNPSDTRQFTDVVVSERMKTLCHELIEGREISEEMAKVWTRIECEEEEKAKRIRKKMVKLTSANALPRTFMESYSLRR